MVHPTISIILNGFMPPAHIKSPTDGLQRFEYTLNDVDLICWLEYEKECRGHGEHPDEPQDATLCIAYVNGVDIFKIMSEKQALQIEMAFLEQDRDDEPDYCED